MIGTILLVILILLLTGRLLIHRQYAAVREQVHHAFH